MLPRNTSAQAVSPALDRLPFTEKVGKAARDRAVTELQVGDLVYIPGHVMMAIGHVDGRTWVIHDTAGGSWFGADGTRVQAHLNGVSVTPLEPMMASDTVRHRPHHQHPAPAGQDSRMKITAIELGMLRVPLKTPFKTALRTVETVEDVVVLIRTDSGNTGYGEAPATAVITGDTHGSIIEAIRHAPRLIGQDVVNLNHLCTLVQTAMERNTSAKAAVEIALYDLWAQLHGAPLYQMLGGGDPVITTDITISVDYIDKMVADSLSAIERGFESLKIKVGKDIGLDIERVKAIHAAVEGRALLRLDANQGWTAKQAVHAMRTLEEAGVVLELLEQPVKAADISGLKYVTDRVNTPVMADESVFSPSQVMDLIQQRAADIINIKLMKTGDCPTRSASPTSPASTACRA